MAETPHPHLLDEAQLMDWTGFRRRGDLEKHLKQVHIPYTYGKAGRIITTIAAINHSLIGNQADTIGSDSIEFE